MRTLARAARRPSDSGSFLPGVFRPLEDAGIRIREGTATYIAGVPGAMKALPLDTPILSTEGWKTMGSLAPGDRIYAPDGMPTEVLACSEVFRERPCYELVMSSGQRVVADEDHLWTVNNPQSGLTMTVSTRDLVRNGVRGRKAFNWRIATPEALVTPDVELPVDPYVLGYWLGDGATRGAEISVHEGDLPSLIERIEKAGYYYKSHPERTCYRVRVSTSPVTLGGGHARDTLQARLRELGVLGNKHIPEQYLLAGTEQRRELLRGLMDSDGTCSTREAKFLSMVRELGEGVAFLARSLGYKASLIQRDVVQKGRNYGPAWHVAFAAPGRDVFHLDRKAEKLHSPSTAAQTRYMQIVAIEPVESRDTRCIRVAHPSHLFLAGEGLVPTHNTGLTLYWVGRLGLPALYFSADSEDFEMVERAGAMMSGDTAQQVRANPGKYAETLASLPIRFCFDDSPTYKDVELEVAAYAEMHGEFPKVIVIDNMLNLVGESEDEWASHRDHAKVIHKLTRITKAAVIVLAHMAEDKADPSALPQPRTKLQGKVSHLPKLIISLAFNGETLKCAAVKNRFGPGDATGRTYAELWVDPTRNTFYNSHHDKLSGRPA